LLHRKTSELRKEYEKPEANSELLRQLHPCGKLREDAEHSEGALRAQRIENR